MTSAVTTSCYTNGHRNSQYKKNRLSKTNLSSDIEESQFISKEYVKEEQIDSNSSETPNQNKSDDSSSSSEEEERENDGEGFCDYVTENPLGKTKKDSIEDSEKGTSCENLQNGFETSNADAPNIDTSKLNIKNKTYV
jgi:hypothetical protein